MSLLLDAALTGGRVTLAVETYTMCDPGRPPLPDMTPRWLGLYAVVPLAGIATLGVHTWVPGPLARTLLDGTVAATVWLTMMGWVRANRVALEQAEWCACASETVRIRVIASGPARSRPGALEEQSFPGGAPR